MSRTTYFIDGCPACGRRLQIRVEFLGKRVRCPHCERAFEAHDSACSDSSIILARADRLLAEARARTGD